MYTISTPSCLFSDLSFKKDTTFCGVFFNFLLTISSISGILITERVVCMIIKYCKMILSPYSCKYILPSLGTRCCKVCEREWCGYRCKNERDKCGCLMEVDTDTLHRKYKRDWSVYK